MYPFMSSEMAEKRLDQACQDDAPVAPILTFRKLQRPSDWRKWIASGASPKAIEQRLVELVEVLPDLKRPLDQLSILVEGSHILPRW